MQQLEGEQEPARKRAEQLLQRRLIKAGLLPDTKKRKKLKASDETSADETSADDVKAEASADDAKVETTAAEPVAAESAPEAAKTNGKSREPALRILSLIHI